MKKAMYFLLVAVLSFVVPTHDIGAARPHTDYYQAQKALVGRGYDPGPVDGLQGPRTKNALERFQRDIGLPETAKLDGPTKKALLGAWGQTTEAARPATPTLLFYHQPSGCPHCAYQMPQIREFQRRHPDVKVDWRPEGSLNESQRKLLEGTTGHPVMVLVKGDHTRQIVGEASAHDLENTFRGFKQEVRSAESSGSTVHASGGSGKVCY